MRIEAGQGSLKNIQGEGVGHVMTQASTAMIFCTNPRPSQGGKPCFGNDFELQPCVDDKCRLCNLRLMEHGGVGHRGANVRTHAVLLFNLALNQWMVNGLRGTSGQLVLVTVDWVREPGCVLVFLHRRRMVVFRVLASHPRSKSVKPKARSVVDSFIMPTSLT
ncbi:hypothetical protein ANCCEY_12412 [Ancylostoma ceylanicum]|uniref:Uncharacterized protein n=1 Tax=Ancylostoma ceylanicum TaxID=53326 RepID=A0A0D6L9R8_9BILA|nr:hypothetical protein ANCCEY_12412 [Ancylostoma ceylanicum]